MAFSGTQHKCTACQKTVYLVDQLTADGIIYHKACFRCNHCKGTLKLGNYASLEGVLYCKPHFNQLFKLTGSYEKSFENKSADGVTPNKLPFDQQLNNLNKTPSKASRLFSGTQEKCVACNKTVYPIERVRDLEEKIWQEELQCGKHISGYGGYQSANDVSANHDIKMPRPTEKDKMMLFDLDQYSREIWGSKEAGYQGHKPQVVQNVKPNYMMNLDHTRHSEYRTTSGSRDMMCQRERAKLKARPPIVKEPLPGEIVPLRKGLASFFEEGGADPRVGTSDNGVLEGEKYFQLLRPYEGTLMAMNAARSIKSRYMQ